MVMGVINMVKRALRLLYNEIYIAKYLPHFVYALWQ